jgi:hypothetical protein
LSHLSKYPTLFFIHGNSETMPDKSDTNIVTPAKLSNDNTPVAEAK